FHLTHVASCPFEEYLPGGYLTTGHPSLLSPDPAMRWVAIDELYKTAALVAVSLALGSFGLLLIYRLRRPRAGLLAAGATLLALVQWQAVGGYLTLGPRGWFAGYTTPTAGPGDTSLSFPIGWLLWADQIQVFVAVCMVLAAWFAACLWVWLAP